jgi:general secretion pathway protein C
MLEYIAKLQKHIYGITVASSVLLGCALAYLLSVILTFFLSSTMTDVGAGQIFQPIPRGGSERTFRSLEEFQGLIAGNFIRDRSMAMPETGMPAEDASSMLGEIQLYGVVAGSPSFASAAIQIQGEKDVNEYMTGQTVVGYKIVKIKWDSIAIERGGNRLDLKIGEKTGVASAAPGMQPGQTIPGAQKISISRDRLIAISNDQTELYKNKFAPITRDGKILGFKLLFVPPENFLYQMGARSGDIIRRFNGQPLESAEKMFEMWQNLKNADRVSIEVERGGKIVPFEIQIQN